ncbi:MAG: 8-oxo-dGTP pyrophosphatase MutT (NUDIX family) [Methylophilaceae bacterium]|jgi:8-oxo-dGTP pyrophosphatase MutT (NUDIX family)
MLVAAKEDGKTYVLFVQTFKHDYYEFPGGRIEHGESLLNGGSKIETPYETAVRETLEETRGSLGQQQLVPVSSPKQLVEVSKFRIFLAKLPFFKLNDLLEIKIPKGKKWSPMREVVNYAWVDVNAVQQSDNVTTRDGEKISLHPIAHHVIKAGRLSHWF